MLRQLTVLAAAAMVAQASLAAQAGKVIYVAGEVQVKEAVASLGSPVQEGDLLSTGASGYMYVKTLDNGLLILRPNTKARIVAYHIDAKNPANTRIKLELISGVARSRSGEAVKAARQNFRFNTPVAAIGVRGTDFTVFTDQNISRVAVISGGITVSGFAGGCSPDGAGPCEGVAARELSAAQRGLLLQVQRGQSAPELLKAGSNGPDVVSPPHASEPVASSVTAPEAPALAAPAPNLESQKQATLDKAVAGTGNNGNNGGNGGTTPQPPVQPPVQPSTPPVVVVPPETTPDPVTPPVTTPTDPIVGGPATPTVPTVPVEPVTPPVVVPVKPPADLIWGRWVSVLGAPAQIDLAQAATNNTLVATNGSYAVLRTPGEAFVAPQGSMGFALKDSVASVRDDKSGAVAAASVQNGQLNVNFGSRSFTTSFDLVALGDTYKLNARGAVGSNGYIYGNNQFVDRPFTNMSVDGALSNANGGSAAYVFSARLETNGSTNGLVANGATYWGPQPQAIPAPTR